MALHIYSGSNASFIEGGQLSFRNNSFGGRFQLAWHFSRALGVIHVRVKCAHTYIFIYINIYIYMCVYARQMIQAFISQMVAVTQLF